jgi:hypothetical protein
VNRGASFAAAGMRCNWCCSSGLAQSEECYTWAVGFHRNGLIVKAPPVPKRERALRRALTRHRLVGLNVTSGKRPGSASDELVFKYSTQFEKSLERLGLGKSKSPVRVW